MTGTFRVLAIDGGGIRGLIPALVLAEIERRTGRPISELFDLIAGTSTGGILALGLVRPGADGRPAYTARDLVALYEDHGPEIFGRSWLRRLPGVGGLLLAKYAERGLEGVLEKYFGETRMSEALTDVLIPSYSIEHRRPAYFKNRRPGGDPRDLLPMREVARATSAAPTYFRPHRISLLPDEDVLVDGGIFANNPTSAAYAEAMERLRVEGGRVGPEDLLIVSLGTGQHTRPLARPALGWGLAGWSTHLIDIVFDSVSDSVHRQFEYMLWPGYEGQAHNYFRFQARLGRDERALDEARPRHLRTLRVIADQMIRDRIGDVAKLCARLHSEWAKRQPVAGEHSPHPS